MTFENEVTITIRVSRASAAYIADLIDSGNDCPDTDELGDDATETAARFREAASATKEGGL